MAHNVPDNVPDAAKISPEVVASHPERLWILGGVWLAIASIGFMGSAALINPDVKLPIIDPLLEMLDQSKQKPDSAVVPVVPVVPAVEEVLPDAAELENLQAIETPEAAPTPAPTPTTDTPTQKNSGGNVPLWVYAIIIASCAAGSSLITYSLYRLNRLNSLASARRQVKQVKSSVKPKHQTVPAKVKLAAKSAKPVKRAPIAVPVGEPVAAIAPLHIKTPTNVEPLQVQLEPVVDPQPIRKKISRAEQLAHLAQQAKQQKPKSLVELMDIRRRDTLAPFP